MSLFHQPSFSDKIHHEINDQDHLIALFAAMFSLSSRYYAEEPSNMEFAPTIPSHSEFHAISVRHVNVSLDACSHDAPALCLLQAMTLTGYYKLIHGVYGAAWRLVGAGIRVAYELRLHLTDHESRVRIPVNEGEISAWSRLEERRRCWWALWEMDCFCSTIQRMPPAIDWSVNKTLLPVSDERWFANKYQASGFLHPSPRERLRNLKASGNENPVAWTSLLFSLMHDAHILCHSSVPGLSNVDAGSNITDLVEYLRNSANYMSYKKATEGLSELVKAYQDIKANLPEALTHHGEPLEFGLNNNDDAITWRRSSAAKYAVGMAKASAIFMIYQNHVYMDMIDGLVPLSSSASLRGSDGRSTQPENPSERRLGLQNFLQASETVLELVDSAPEDHIKYVNPYYASTVWIAAALQAFKRRSQWDPSPELTERRLAALRQIYLRFVHFWGTPLSLLNNMDSLESRLDARLRALEDPGKDRDPWDPGRSSGPHLSTCATEVGQNQVPDCSPESLQHELGSVQVGQLSSQTFEKPGYLSTPRSLAIPDAEWLSTIGPEASLSEDPSGFPPGWTSALADDLFVDDFAFYSSDLAARLFHGYTT